MNGADILIIDKDPRFTAAISAMIEMDYQVRPAHSWEAAMEQLLTRRPSLIVLGYLEPRGTSFHIHREIKSRSQWNRIPLLVIDVCPKEHMRKGWRKSEGMQMDAEGYLNRPLSSGELKAEILRALDSCSLREIAWQNVLERKEEDLIQKAAS
jgi:PleD family two-component response regulator